MLIKKFLTIFHMKKIAICGVELGDSEWVHKYNNLSSNCAVNRTRIKMKTKQSNDNAVYLLRRLN